MRKRVGMILCFLLLLVSVIYINDIPVQAAQPKLSVTMKTLFVDNSFTLRLDGAIGKTTWKSLDSGVATVKDGVVTGVAKGTTDIIAKNNGKEYTCTIKVWNPYLSETDKKIKVGDSFKLSLRGRKAVKWISSKNPVVSVDENGKITAHKSGNANIYAFDENGKQYCCSVLAYQPVNTIKNPKFSDLAPTVNMTFEELVGDNGNYEFPKAFPVAGTYKIIVDLYYKVVMAYTLDDNGEYTVPVRYMLCSCGASATPTPTGTFKMESYRLRFNLFANTPSWAQYWSIIAGRIYFHSILYTSDNARDYTTSWSNLGSAVSHGCIRLTVPDARWIWYNVAPGTTIEIRSGSSSDEKTKSIRDQLVLPKLPSSRPDLKKGEIPDTDNWTLEDVLQEQPFVQGSQNGGEAAY